MDLSTVEQKLKTGKYANFHDFQADIFLIIENSYAVNSSNKKGLKITSEFESYFHQISEEIVNKNNKNKKKNRKRKNRLSAAFKSLHQ